MTVPDLGAAAVFRAIVSAIVVERLPLGFAGGAIHATALDTVHAHPVSVSIATGTSPPAAETVVFGAVTL